MLSPEPHEMKRRLTTNRARPIFSLFSVWSAGGKAAPLEFSTTHVSCVVTQTEHTLASEAIIYVLLCTVVNQKKRDVPQRQHKGEPSVETD